MRLGSAARLLAFPYLMHLRIAPPLWFLVELGVAMMLASTMVPLLMQMPLRSKYRFTVSRIRPHSSSSSSKYRKTKNTGLIRRRCAFQIDASEMPQHRRLVERILPHPGQTN